MITKRYGFLIADRTTGAVHRFSLRVRPAVALFAAILALPIGWSVHSRWTAQSKIDELRLQNARLEIENSSYRATAAELTGSIQALRTGITDLASRLEVPAVRTQPIERLPESFRTATLGEQVPTVAPDATFNVLSRLLSTLGQRLQVVRHGVALREALADATPNKWPANGWLSASYGYREDPFTGERDFHPAVDISTRRGQPVYAPATGRITSAGRSGNYGNLIEIAHGFGLSTRYGHLSDYAVNIGDTVMRGDVIGYVGATGRATGYHVHYEVWINGRTLNPLRLLPENDSISAN